MRPIDANVEMEQRPRRGRTRAAPEERGVATRSDSLLWQHDLSLDRRRTGTTSYYKHYEAKQDMDGPPVPTNHPDRRTLRAQTLSLKLE